MPRGSARAALALFGVAVPGVEGGVNAGERREDGGGCVNGVDGSAERVGEPSFSERAVEEAGLLVETEKSAWSTSPS